MKVDELERALRDERPELGERFAGELDEWARDGFPRDRGLGPRTGRGPRLRPFALAWAAARRARGRLASVPLRRALLPVGAAATVLVVGAVVIGQAGEEGRGLAGEPAGAPSAIEADGDGEAADGGGEDASSGAEALPGQAPETADGYTLDAPGAGALATPPQGGGGIARAAEPRLVDATARLTLGADADDVQEVANRVVEVTDRYGGIVLDSQVTSDQAGARAAFTLELPYAELDGALDELSGLADVISRTEAGQDITQRAVRSRRQLAGVLEDLRGARIELIRADTREERLIAKSEIDSLKASADALRAELGGVRREARFATVAVEVTSSDRSSADEGWSISEALDDAGRVLETIAGVALVALAVLVPVGLVAALGAWIALRARARGRERALDRG